MAEQGATINLRVLSPSAEVEGGITFPDLPTTTTIHELRSRIQDAVPSKPATDRMRLIYRGRVVANDADTLGGVFGAENIRESKEQSLHLVLRELPTNGLPPPLVPRTSTVPPNPFRPAQPPIPASPSLHTNPFRAVPQPQPGSQPQAPPPPHHHHNHPHGHLHHLPGPPNPFQMPLPPALQQHLAHTQQHLAHAMGVANAQAIDAQAQGRTEGTPPQGNGPPPPPLGLPALPGFGPPVFPPNAGRTVRQEGMGPNGERWSVTYSNANMFGQGQNAMLPPGFLQPPGLGAPLRPSGSPVPTEAIDRLLPQLRQMLESARQDMESVRTLLQASGQQNAQPTPPFQVNPPAWRLQRIRQHVQTMGHNLDLVERGLSVIAADASMTGNADVIALGQSANELRGQLADLDRMVTQRYNAGPAQPASVGNTSPLPSAAMTATTPPATSQPEIQASTQTLPPNVPEELFILGSPQGPVGILFDQRGTYMTAPIVPTLPFQTFTNQFAQNRQLIAGIGQHMAQGSGHMHHQLANIQPTPTQPFTTPGQAQTQGQTPAPGADQVHAQAHDPNHVQPQAPAQNAAANPPQVDNDRIGNIFGHVWLVFKLACFVYFFSGTGWYKSLLLGFIAGCVYLAQLGLFDSQFALIRRHFEALLPMGGGGGMAQAPAPVNTPEEAARRLLLQQRRGGWVRESMRSVERAGAIFVASLWPGIGERMVHAQEERERLERVARIEAEEEGVRVEEERIKKVEEEKEAEKRESDEKEREREEGGSSKGKERAEEEVIAPVS